VNKVRSVFATARRGVGGVLIEDRSARATVCGLIILFWKRLIRFAAEECVRGWLL